jgi:hypothetical protein
MVRNQTIAAAVAAVLSTGSAFAGTSTLLTGSQAQSPFQALYIAGSSAAKNAILAVLEGPTLCNGSYSVFSSTGDTNFFAVSCQPTSATGFSGANGTNIYTVWYRAEGGSVTGALPLVAGNTIGSSIRQMNLTNATQGPTLGYSVSVPGSATFNGLDDSFPTNTFEAPVQLGITDVEPSALVKSNYPSAYKTSVYGSATAAQLAALSKTAIFDQVFGIFVNTQESQFTSSQQSGHGAAVGGTASGLALSKQAIANILDLVDTDWSTVTDVNGNAVTATSAPITLINREAGSGSRTATDIFFTGDSCLTTTSSILGNNIQETGAQDYFSTSDLLNAANTTPGSIAYATIDQAGSSFPNLTLVALDGIQPTSLAAASGEYGDWFEAFAVTGPNTPTTGDGKSLVTSLIKSLQNINNSIPSGQADLLGNPLFDAAVGPALPISGTTGTGPASSSPKAIYTNPFSRGGVSCSSPASEL